MGVGRERSSHLFAATMRIAAGWAAVCLAPELTSGLLDEDRPEFLTEAVITQGALKNARIRIRSQAKQVVVSHLPAVMDPAKIRLCVGEETYSPSVVKANEVQFDLSEGWREGEHQLILSLDEDEPNA